ncbi:hypothetical protein BJV78DRAFT_1153864 [Lactifluus subvellereus]|nr:hypothetical protein BJV78DRAFT_1153864 [Lactifluus subvellereus]
MSDYEDIWWFRVKLRNDIVQEIPPRKLIARLPDSNEDETGIRDWSGTVKSKNKFRIDKYLESDDDGFGTNTDIDRIEVLCEAKRRTHLSGPQRCQTLNLMRKKCIAACMRTSKKVRHHKQ